MREKLHFCDHIAVCIPSVTNTNSICIIIWFLFCVGRLSQLIFFVTLYKMHMLHSNFELCYDFLMHEIDHNKNTLENKIVHGLNCWQQALGRWFVTVLPCIVSSPNKHCSDCRKIIGECYLEENFSFGAQRFGRRYVC